MRARLYMCQSFIVGGRLDSTEHSHPPNAACINLHPPASCIIAATNLRFFFTLFLLRTPLCWVFDAP